VRKDCAQPTARLLYHTEALLEAGAEVCGITTLLFYDLQTGRAWQYPWPLGQSSWVSKLHRLRGACRPNDLEGFCQSGGIRWFNMVLLLDMFVMRMRRNRGPMRDIVPSHMEW
jgi:hypothetical protein